MLVHIGNAPALFFSKVLSPSYLDFCFFKSIPHMITATKKTRIRYHRFSRQKPLSNINWYPQEAGNIRPVISRKRGSKSMGNIIPESIIEGRNTNCAIIVSFAWFFIISPKILPMLNDTIMYIASAKKKTRSCSGKTASNNLEASNTITAQLIIKCTNVEINIVTRPKETVIPFTL